GPVNRPVAGSSTTAPRARRVATFATVAGCSHISVCMAGAYSTGQRAVSRVLVSRSSAMPTAARASRSAVAGATTTRSASCPIRTCGTSYARDQTSSATGCPESASQVAAPTNRSAAAVGTTVTRWPASVSSRSSSAALYAAIPPATPRSTRATRDRGLAVGRRGRQQAGVDLPHGDRQRLLLRGGLHQRPDVLQQALAELAVVGVDLACPLGREDHQRVLGRGLLQQLVDRRVGDALGLGDGSSHDLPLALLIPHRAPAPAGHRVIDRGSQRTAGLSANRGS